MNALEIIYLIGALAVGTVMGMVIEMMIDAGTIRDLQAENRKLRLMNSQLAKEPEIIEIVDNRESKDIQFGGF